MKPKLLLPFLSIVLLSCYTQTITVNPDKRSGTIVLNYTLNQEFIPELSGVLAQVSSTGGSSNSLDIMSLTDAAAFRRNFKNSNFLTLQSVNISLQGDTYNGRITLAFTDFERAFAEIPSGFIRPSVVRNGNRVTISQRLLMSDLDPERMLNTLLMQLEEDDPQYYGRLINSVRFVFEIVTPTPVTAHQGVTLVSANKVSFSFNINDLLATTEKNFSVQF